MLNTCPVIRMLNIGFIEHELTRAKKVGLEVVNNCDVCICVKQQRVAWLTNKVGG